MSSDPNDKEIRTFWSWFEAIAEKLGDDFDNPQLLDELDAMVARLGDIAWELGPGSRTENALAISPDGDPDLLPLTQRIVSMAPEVSGWEFLWARPARSASLEFSVTASGGDEIEIDARPWRYVLFKTDHKTFDLVLEESNLWEASDDDRYTAAIVLLDGLLGEEARLLRIRDVEPVVALTAEQGPKANAISILPAHLDSLCSV